MSNYRVITVGISEYPQAPDWTIAEAGKCRQDIAQLFSRHGATVEDWTSDARFEPIHQRFENWSNNRRSELLQPPTNADPEPDDDREGDDRIEPCILYWVGHGEDTGYPDNRYRLALADSTAPLSSSSRAFKGDDLLDRLLDQQRRRRHDPNAWVLVILDTCGSGSGAWRIHAGFKPPETAYNLGLVATTDDGAAFAGTFPAMLRDVMNGFSGNDSDGIPVYEMLRRLETLLGIGTNKILSSISATATIPTASDELGPVAGPVDIVAELRRVTKERPSVVINHFYAKAQGAEIGELAWHFKGRELERRTITRWLDTAPHGLLVITGDAGSGKSALLGMTLASTDSELMTILEQEYDVGGPDLRPKGVSFHATLTLTGADITTFVTDLSSALGLPIANNPDELAAAVKDRTSINRLSIMVDALDESRDPFTIAATLRRLATQIGVRIIVGTRRSLGEDPDHPGTTNQNLLAVLQAPADDILTLDRDRDAVWRYTQERLRAALPDHDADEIDGLAERIAAYHQPFLFARLAVHEITRTKSWLQPGANLDGLLSAGHGGIFDTAIQRFTNTAPATAALLHALAYARGNGFPRTNGIWAEAGSSLLNDRINDIQIRQTLQTAAPYIMQDSEYGQTVYRLGHRTFVERYRRRDLSVNY